MTVVCSHCESKLISKKGYVATSKIIGKQSMASITTLYCPSCEDVLLTNSEAQKVSRNLKLAERAAIGQLAIDDFVTLTEAAKLLRVSKQAVSKNPRIKRGLVFFVKKGSSVLYHKKSLELFKANGDGRFKLVSDTKEANIEESAYFGGREWSQPKIRSYIPKLGTQHRPSIISSNLMGDR